MPDMGTCDICGKPGRWAMVVVGCADHRAALKSAVGDCYGGQRAADYAAAMRVLKEYNRGYSEGEIMLVSQDITFYEEWLQAKIKTGESHG